MPVVLLIFGIFLIVLFHSAYLIPIWASIAIILSVSLFLREEYKKRRVGLLVCYLWFVYLLPFIHLLPYLWFDFSSEPILLWGLATNPYMLDEKVMELTALLGAAGGVGLALGVSLDRGGHSNIFPQTRIQKNVTREFLSMPIFIVWVSIGIILSWLSAPEASVFTTSYTNSYSPLEGKNFGSAWMISYIVLAYTFCDAILDRSPVIKKQKLIIAIASISYVVVILQLLRGDRESIPFVFGLILLFFYWAAPITRHQKLRLPWLKITFLAFLIVVVSMIIGAMRSVLVGVENLDQVLEVVLMLYDSEIVGFSNLLNGTWSAVLLTPLSVAGDYIYGLLDLELGQTYSDLILSLPPGILADTLGYTRPIDGLSGPAWKMRYGIGGTHASVVPFMNFRITGVILVTALWSFLLVRIEKRVVERSTVRNFAFLCTMVLAAPHWLWYGEKSGMNAIIIWFLLSIFYRISLGFSRLLMFAPRIYSQSVSEIHLK